VARDAADGVEVLLVRRHPDQRFMGGVWVFPGGAVDRGETPARTAIRELREEAGIELGEGAELAEFSRWVTPREVKVRFDTHFFVTPAPPGCRPCPDGEECVAVRWITPPAALAEWRAGKLELVFPTIKHLELLAQFDSTDALMSYARSARVEPVEPRVIVDTEGPRVVLPGEPGY